MEKKEYLEEWKKAKADLVNYKNEESKRVARLMAQVEEDFILEIILILDNIEIAEKNISADNEWSQGFQNIKKQIISLLDKKGVKQIETKNKVFDPVFHEAVEVVDDSRKKTNTIIGEVQKGYLFKDKVIRPAKVKVIK